MSQRTGHFKRLFARLGPATRRALARLNQRKGLLLLVLAAAFLYSSLSVLRHRHFTSSAYDLAIFDQAIWRYSNFEPPYVTVRSNRPSENLLGDHFHPILVLLAPLYWLVNSVEALLVAQALLFAAAIIPIFLFTEKRLGPTAAYLFSASYALFWGVQKAVEFDFHEISFAVPLLALAIYFMDDKRWRPYFVCLALLLLTKESLSVTVFFFGVYLVLTRQFKQGLISMCAGLVWFLAATKIFIPYLLDPGTTRADRPGYYRYWSYHQFGPGPLSALVTIIKRPLLLIQTLLSPAEKLRTYWLLFHPFLFLALLSPLFVLLAPLLAERFLSQNPHFWTADFHYSATIAPVLVMASADGLARLAGLVKGAARRYVIILAACAVLALNLRLVPQFPLWNLTRAVYWRLTESDLTGRRALALIPPGASVLTQGPVTPHLSHRRQLYTLGLAEAMPDADFIVVSESLSPFPFPSHEDSKRFLDFRQSRGYRKIFDEGGWVVLKNDWLTREPERSYYGAAFVEQYVPSSMTAGQSYEVSVTMKNTGINRWTAERSFRLAYLDGTRDWGLERVELPSAIEPDGLAKFSFTVTAPATPGAYTFHWGMVQDGLFPFGENAPQVWVEVTPPAR